MKHLLCLTLLFVLTSSCEKDIIQTEIPSLPNTWWLEATLFDPGDGSGVFEPVERDRGIVFTNPNRVVTNGSFCDLAGASGPDTATFYDEEMRQIVVEDCVGSGADIRLDVEFTAGADVFTISLPCTDPCQLRFRRF